MNRRLEDWLDSYMQYTEGTEPSPLYNKWCAISTIASVMQRKCFSHNGNDWIYPNFYIVLVGPSSARKGTAMKYAWTIAKASGVKLMLAPSTTTRERMIAVLQNCFTAHPGENGSIVEHTSMIIHSEELTVLIGQRNFQFIQDLTDWYDCKEVWDYSTKGSGEYVLNNIWVNLLGAITPELIQAALPMEAIVGGLTQRMILIFSPGKHKTVPYPVLDRELASKLADDLEWISFLCGEYKFTKGFLEMYHDWYRAQDEINPIKDSRFDGYAGRRQVFVWKLAMICCASRGDRMVMEVKDFERAVSILEEAEVPMSSALSGVGKSPLSGSINKVATVIAFRKVISKGDLMKLFHNDLTLEELDMVLQMLEMEGMIDKVIGGQHDAYRYKGVEIE